MKKTTAIWTFGMLGWGVSYAHFLDYLIDNEWDFFGGWAEAFTASVFGAGLLWDLVAVTAMMLVLAVVDRRRLGTKWTVAVIASLGLSVSISLAIYLVRIWRVERAAPAEV